MPTDRRARAHELIDLLLGAIPDEAPSTTYDDLSDEELLNSPIGTRVREILFHRLEAQGKEFYANARLKGSGSTMLAGITLARDWVFPEDTWAYGFRDASEWEPKPYEPTVEDFAELLRRIAARDYKVERDQVEALAMQIAEENGWCADEVAAEEAPEPVETAEPEDWGVVVLARKSQSPLRRAKVHKASCSAMAKVLRGNPTAKRTLSSLWDSMVRGHYADGPEPINDLTTLYTLCTHCGADKALQEAKGDDLEAWKNGARLAKY